MPGKEQWFHLVVHLLWPLQRERSRSLMVFALDSGLGGLGWALAGWLCCFHERDALVSHPYHLINWLTEWMNDWRMDWLIAWLNDWPAEGIIDWLTNYPMVWLSDNFFLIFWWTASYRMGCRRDEAKQKQQNGVWLDASLWTQEILGR